MPRRDDPLDLDAIEVTFDDEVPDGPGGPHGDDEVPDGPGGPQGDDEPWTDPTEAHPEVADLLDDFETALEGQQLDAAEAVLRELEPHAQVVDEAFETSLGDLFELLAFELLDGHADHDRCLRLQERAVELGCEDQVSARITLAWWLLDDGQRDRGEDLFAELLDADPDGVQLRVDLGLARTDTDPDGALIAFDEAVDLARRTGDVEGLRSARIEREDLRHLRGLAPDDDDRAAHADRRAGRNATAAMLHRDAVEGRGGRLPPDAPERNRTAVGWFVDAELPAARERWPRLSRATTDTPEAQRRATERGLRDLRTAGAAGTGPLGVVGFTVAEVAEAGVDPTRPRGLDDLAEARHAEGRSAAWPPDRNAPCWCGSQRKYKRCCGGF